MSRPWRIGAVVALGCFAACVAVGRAADKPATKPAAPTTGPAAGEWQSLFDGKTLKGWKSSDFAAQGEPEVEDGAILLPLGESLTGVTYTGEVPKINYEVSLEAKRVEGHDFFCGLTVPVGNDFASLIVGGWGGSVVGISSLYGEDAAHNETTKNMRFKTGQWYRIRLRVQEGRIQAWIDDEQVVDVSTKGKKISIRDEVEGSKPFGISSWRTTAAVKDIKVRKLPADELKK